MPPPGKGSGGHMNIYRFIEYLEKSGHECRIYIYTQFAPGKVSDIKVLMGDSYPKLKASMVWIDNGDEMEPADGIFATSWETAYASFNSSTVGKRFYFVQDFEPYFYPVGTLSSLAENSYKFGFYGVTAGNWLATKLKADYGMQTDYFDFGSDPTTYNYLNNNKRKEIFFYARPYTERRGFEMGIMALDLFHQKHPDYVINLAGWDVSEYDIPFPYVNLQTLEINELNALYNRCAVGLVMSLTNMSLLPLELLGSGTIPVVNDGDNNRLVSDNPYIAYAENNPVALANALCATVERKDAEKYAKKASESVKTASWDDSGKKFVGIVERETRKSE
jgi:glycosyltransferase involved in cell wall biosynthesis